MSRTTFVDVLDGGELDSKLVELLQLRDVDDMTGLAQLGWYLTRRAGQRSANAVPYPSKQLFASTLEHVVGKYGEDLWRAAVGLHFGGGLVCAVGIDENNDIVGDKATILKKDEELRSDAQSMYYDDVILVVTRFIEASKCMEEMCKRYTVPFETAPVAEIIKPPERTSSGGRRTNNQFN